MNEDYMFEDEDNNKESSQPTNENSAENQGFNGAYDGPRYGCLEKETAEDEETYGMAIASLVLGLISITLFLFGINILFSIIGLVLGIIFLCARKTKGNGLAIAGIITSILSIVLFIGSWYFIFANIDNIANLEDDGQLEQVYEYYYGDMLDDMMQDYPGYYQNDEIDLDDTL